MPRTCTACVSPQRGEIDRAVLAGEPYRDIARRRACSKDAVARHRAHIETAMVEAKKADDARDTDELLDELAELVRDARRLGEKAEAIGDCKGALMGVRERGRIAELKARIAGRITGAKVEINPGAGGRFRLRAGIAASGEIDAAGGRLRAPA